VQDFSYAAMYLICSVAGRKEARWVAAGDTAQMITPGCSFTFDGLKQTLRAIKDTVKINKVEQLTRNYRVSKGVLVAGNAILRLLKTHYPRALEYAPPEKAMKDLGLPVVLLDWDKAVKNQVSFGVKQAVIYTSSDDPTGVVESVSQWIGKHPFILSSLESKGLEFEGKKRSYHTGSPIHYMVALAHPAVLVRCRCTCVGRSAKDLERWSGELLEFESLERALCCCDTGSAASGCVDQRKVPRNCGIFSQSQLLH
jgi:hypothetical protein